MVIDCFIALGDNELTEQERITSALIIFYDIVHNIEDLDKLPDIDEAVNQMYLFFNCGKEDVDDTHHPKLIDWEKDELLICSAINHTARTEIRALPYLHWWSFMGYYMAINESFLSTIVGIRSKIVKGKKLEKHEREFKRENPNYFNWDARSVEEKEADTFIRDLWNKNSNKS